MIDEGIISKLAHAGKPPESALPHEWLLWYRLRDIYTDVKSGRITMEQGRAAKQTAVNDFHADRDAWDRDTLLWRRIELPAKTFAREQTVEAANELYRALYRLGPVKHKKENEP